jgi:hypothetical protein
MRHTIITQSMKFMPQLQSHSHLCVCGFIGSPGTGFIGSIEIGFDGISKRGCLGGASKRGCFDGINKRSLTVLIDDILEVDLAGIDIENLGAGEILEILRDACVRI